MLQRIDHPRPLRICFVCNTSVRANGGTAAYERFITTALAKTCSVSAVARFVDVPARQSPNYSDGDGPSRLQDGGVTTILLGPRSTLAAKLLSRLPSLLSRKRLNWAAQALHRIAYRSDLAHAIPADTDVVHFIGTGWEALGLTAEVVSRAIGAAFVVTPFVHPGQWGDAAVDLNFYRRADAIIVESDVEANHLVRGGLSPAKLHKIGLGPGSDLLGDGDRFRRTRGLGTRPLVLFVARRQKYKGYHVLREAMNEVLQTFPDAALVVIGPDTEPPYPPLPNDAVVDLGTLSWSSEDQQLKADALAACDVFCMPSIAEAFGIVYVEAWSYGKPVIGGPAPAVQELIRDSSAGVILDCQDPSGIAAAVIDLLSDASQRNRMGKAGAALVRERFNWTAVAESHLKLFSRVLDQRKRT